MQVTAEIRWFWEDEPPRVLEAWFRDANRHGTAPGGGAVRVDEYLLSATHAELGVKRRGSAPGIELKGMVDRRGASVLAIPFFGPLELWCKWTVCGLESAQAPVLAIEKQRWLRLFDTGAGAARELAVDAEGKPSEADAWPARGCMVEWTCVRHGNGGICWTLGFEAFGGMQTVQGDLRAVASLLASRRPPPLRGARLQSYAMWVAEHAAGAGQQAHA